MRALLLALLLVSPWAHAGSRARYGGTLRVALAAQQTEADPLLADTPSEAALVGLLSRSVCRLDRSGRSVGVLAELSRPSLGVVRLTSRPGLRFSNGLGLGAAEIAASFVRASGASSASPYRALLFPLQGQGQKLSSAVGSKYALDLTLAFPWPDLERSLCHPALAVVDARGERPSGVGPFRPGAQKGEYLQNLSYPEGRPYADALTVTATDERGAARLLSLRRADVSLGGADETGLTGPALYATYLAYRSAAVGPEFRAAFDAAIDRADLTRFFVRAPATAMSGLLPPALQPQGAPGRSPAAPAPVRPTRELTLLFDEALADQRSVAERIQVKLHDRGYRIALKGLSRGALRSRWAAGDYELLLHSLLLPPAPASALAVVIDAAGRRDLLSTQLPALGAIADQSARDRRTGEVSVALAGTLELVPLYAQGLRISAARELSGLGPDPQGLPTLDSAFLSAD